MGRPEQHRDRQRRAARQAARGDPPSTRERDRHPSSANVVPTPAPVPSAVPAAAPPPRAGSPRRPGRTRRRDRPCGCGGRPGRRVRRSRGRRTSCPRVFARRPARPGNHTGTRRRRCRFAVLPPGDPRRRSGGPAPRQRRGVAVEVLGDRIAARAGDLVWPALVQVRAAVLGSEVAERVVGEDGGPAAAALYRADEARDAVVLRPLREDVGAACGALLSLVAVTLPLAS